MNEIVNPNNFLSNIGCLKIIQISKSLDKSQKRNFVLIPITVTREISLLELLINVLGYIFKGYWGI